MRKVAGHAEALLETNRELYNQVQVSSSSTTPRTLLGRPD
jgi:hypothetical protein